MLVLAVILLGMREDLDEATEALEQWCVAYYHVAAKNTPGASEGVE